MNKEFVSYEIALALKELGFDEPCFATYDEDRNFELQDFLQTYETFPSHIVAAPIFSQAFRWFREKYGLFYDNLNYIGNVWKFSTYSAKEEDYFQSAEYKTYEEAELACLRKLIEIAKENKQ